MLVYLCEQERERERGGLQCKLVSTPESFCFYFVKPLKDRVYVILYSSHCQLLEETKTSNQLFFPFLVFRDVDLVKMKFKPNIRVGDRGDLSDCVVVCTRLWHGILKTADLVGLPHILATQKGENIH